MIKIFFYSFFVINILYSQDDVQQEEKEKKEKTYTQKEFDDELKKRIKEKVGQVLEKIRPKNLTNFSRELIEKEEGLRVREFEAEKKEEQLALLSQELEKKILDFQKNQENFIACAEGVNKEGEDRIKHMVSVVSSMRPQSAADILSVQEPSLAVNIMGLLTAEKVAKIFNLMDKEISARLQKQYMTMKK